MDDDTRALLTASVRELLAGTAPDADIEAPLADLGWGEVLADDPAAAWELLFTEHGRALARTRVLDQVVLAEIADLLPAPRGPRAVAHPHPGDVDSAGLVSAATPLPTARGIVLGPLEAIAEIVHPVSTSDGVGIALLTPGDLVAEPMVGFDRSLRWTAVTPVGAPVAVAHLGGRWSAVVAAARRALAAEMLGTAECMLATAVEHTSARVQFGHPVAAFQAVRHRLAEAHTALAAASGLLRVAASTGEAWPAAVAKAQAGRVQREVAAHALQVCGALGLSEEFRLHRWVSRAAVLDALHVPGERIEAVLGRELLAPDAAGRPLPGLVDI